MAVMNLPTSAGDIRDAGSIPGSRSSPGGGHSNPLQYSCLENPMDRGAWQTTVHKVTESDTIEALSTHTSSSAYGVGMIISTLQIRKLGYREAK